jgi:hypothetical protein
VCVGAVSVCNGQPATPFPGYIFSWPRSLVPRQAMWTSLWPQWIQQFCHAALGETIQGSPNLFHPVPVELDSCWILSGILTVVLSYNCCPHPYRGPHVGRRLTPSGMSSRIPRAPIITLLPQWLGGLRMVVHTIPKGTTTLSLPVQPSVSRDSYLEVVGVTWSPWRRWKKYSLLCIWVTSWPAQSHSWNVLDIGCIW